MFAFFLAVMGIAIFGGSFVKFQIFHISVTYIVMLALMISYVRFFAIKKDVLRINKNEKYLVEFELYGLIFVFFSFIGINKFFISNELFTAARYIPRQAYYLFFVPAIIMFQDKFYTEKLDGFIKKYGSFAFWFIYILHIIVIRKFAIGIPTEMVLCWLDLSISGTRITKARVLRLILLIFTPIAVGGELTNIFIRLVYLAYFLFNKNRKILFRYMGLVMNVMIGAIFLMPIFLGMFSSTLDANSLWKLRYWNDELTQLLKSHLLGVGYGTSYATKDFIGGSLYVIGGPFGASSEYSVLDQLFVTGPHSSFISLAFRLGLIGLLLFILFLKATYKELLHNHNRLSPSVCFIFVSSIIIISFNVGLESPYYLMLFVFAMGRCIQETSNYSVGVSILPKIKRLREASNKKAFCKGEIII